jgi:hypothetical protein
LNTQCSKGTIVAVQVGAVKIYVAAVEALRQKERYGYLEIRSENWFILASPQSQSSGGGGVLENLNRKRAKGMRKVHPSKFENMCKLGNWDQAHVVKPIPPKNLFVLLPPFTTLVNIGVERGQTTSELPLPR